MEPEQVLKFHYGQIPWPCRSSWSHYVVDQATGEMLAYNSFQRISSDGVTEINMEAEGDFGMIASRRTFPE